MLKNLFPLYIDIETFAPNANKKLIRQLGRIEQLILAFNDTILEDYNDIFEILSAFTCMDVLYEHSLICKDILDNESHNHTEPKGLGDLLQLQNVNITNLIEIADIFLQKVCPLQINTLSETLINLIFKYRMMAPSNHTMISVINRNINFFGGESILTNEIPWWRGKGFRVRRTLFYRKIYWELSLPTLARTAEKSAILNKIDLDIAYLIQEKRKLWSFFHREAIKSVHTSLAYLEKIKKDLTLQNESKTENRVLHELEHLLSGDNIIAICTLLTNCNYEKQDDQTLAALLNRLLAEIHNQIKRKVNGENRVENINFNNLTNSIKALISQMNIKELFSVEIFDKSIAIYKELALIPTDLEAFFAGMANIINNQPIILKHIFTPLILNLLELRLFPEDKYQKLQSYKTILQEKFNHPELFENLYKLIEGENQTIRTRAKEYIEAFLRNSNPVIPFVRGEECSSPRKLSESKVTVWDTTVKNVSNIHHPDIDTKPAHNTELILRDCENTFNSFTSALKQNDQQEIQSKSTRVKTKAMLLENLIEKNQREHKDHPLQQQFIDAIQNLKKEIASFNQAASTPLKILIDIEKIFINLVKLSSVQSIRFIQPT